MRIQCPLQICHVQNLSNCAPCDRGPIRRIRWCPGLCSKHRGRRFAFCRKWSIGRAPRLLWRCPPAPAHAAPVLHPHRYSQVRQACLLEEVCTQWHIATRLSRLLRILRRLRLRQLLDSSLLSLNSTRKTQNCRSAQRALSCPSAARAIAAGLFWGVGPSARFGPER